MLIFWVIALLMIVIALVLILPAFWGRYQSAGTTFNEQNIQVARDRLEELKQQHDSNAVTDEKYQQQRDELEKALAIDLSEVSKPDIAMVGDKRTVHVLVLVFLILIFTFSLYFSLGTPEVLLQQGTLLAQAPSQQAAPEHSMDELVTRLEQRLAANPQDAEGWMMLGRSYMSLKRYPEAARAFELVISQVGEKPTVLLAQADALAMSQAGRLSGKPAELVHKALKLSPNNVTGLWLAGLIESEQGNNQQAIVYWRKVEKLLVNDPGSLKEIRGLIAQTGGSATSTELSEAGKPVSSVGITVKVTLANELKSKVQPDDTVFVYARAVQGARMPLAIVRKKASDLPLEVVLTDQLAVIPDMTISKFNQVKIIARVSKAGSATARSGDLLGESDPVSTTNPSTISIKLNKVVP